ncbi:uncharacterized protein Dsimw501_GD28370 [Drosophila simulans]|uniref:Uncharacterized protein n=1 Tax=Drosophila simulans TaxID=7240 RepID=A0A0J9RTB1_DROSI|nr:uncharacterized protein Dsimw501_GD28370 [Drosophila simulans]
MRGFIIAALSTRRELSPPHHRPTQNHSDGDWVGGGTLRIEWGPNDPRPFVRPGCLEIESKIRWGNTCPSLDVIADTLYKEGSNK